MLFPMSCSSFGPNLSRGWIATISARKTALKGKLLHGFLDIAVSSGHSEEFEFDPRQPVSTRRVPLTSDAIHRYLKRARPLITWP